MQNVEAKDVDFNRLRFLIVDDNPHMRRILRTLLHSFGAREVHEAEDGASGLEAYSNHAPDVVILDWIMPIFDGLELTQMIRQPDITVNPFVPIILLTAHTGKRRILAARDAGVSEVLAKPISAKSLHDRIVATVAKPRKFVRTETYFGPEHRRELKPLASEMLGLPYHASSRS
jgi:CheY-like chemotaxis protein